MHILRSVEYVCVSVFVRAHLPVLYIRWMRFGFQWAPLSPTQPQLWGWLGAAGTGGTPGFCGFSAGTEPCPGHWGDFCLCTGPHPPCLIPYWWDPQPFLLALQMLFENISPCLFLRCIWRSCHLHIFRKFLCSDKSMAFKDAVHSCLYCKASFFLSFLQCFWSFVFVLMTWHPNRSMSCWFVLICVSSRNQLFLVQRCGGEEILRLFRGFLAGVITGFVIHVQYPWEELTSRGKLQILRGLSKTCFWCLWISFSLIKSEVVNSVDQNSSPFPH